MWTQVRGHVPKLSLAMPSLWRMSQSLVVMLAAACVVSACSVFVSNDEFGMAWSGKPVEQLKYAWGQPNGEEQHLDGSTEIRYDMTAIRCTYWFTVNNAGKIAAYRYVVGQWGSCKPS